MLSVVLVAEDASRWFADGVRGVGRHLDGLVVRVTAGFGRE